LKPNFTIKFALKPIKILNFMKTNNTWWLSGNRTRNYPNQEVAALTSQPKLLRSNYLTIYHFKNYSKWKKSQKMCGSQRFALWITQARKPQTQFHNWIWN
jgi:hypothetical protein